MHNTLIKKKLASYLKLLHRYRGEPVGAYDEVSIIDDDFAKVWDQHVAAPALAGVNHLIEERVKPGAVVLACRLHEPRAMLTEGRYCQVERLAVTMREKGRRRSR